jgi:hypothetical protein
LVSEECLALEAGATPSGQSRNGATQRGHGANT